MRKTILQIVIVLTLFGVLLLKIYHAGWMDGFNERDSICKEYHNPERLERLCR